MPGIKFRCSLPGKRGRLLDQGKAGVSMWLDGRLGRPVYDVTVSLGIADRVTAFTASDFGRTLNVNATGSDHGWGSMHFVMGGAVNGRAYYGAPPAVANNGPDDAGQGRLLPTTSVD